MWVWKQNQVVRLSFFVYTELRQSIPNDLVTTIGHYLCHRREWNTRRYSRRKRRMKWTRCFCANTIFGQFSTFIPSASTIWTALTRFVVDCVTANFKREQMTKANKERNEEISQGRRYDTIRITFYSLWFTIIYADTHIRAEGTL